MNWIKTKTTKFIEEEVIGIQYLQSNYSRATPETIIFLRGGGQMSFIGAEADEIWGLFEDSSEEKQD